MASVTRVPLGVATVVRKYYLDINTGTYAAPSWIPVSGVSDFKPSGQKPTLLEDSDFDSTTGAKSQIKTAYDWDITCTVQRKRKASDATAYDVGQEALRTAGRGVLAANVVDIRYYEVNEETGPKVEAYRGYAAVTYAPAGGALEALDAVAITMTGRGALSVTTHPDAAATVPTITSCVPATAAAAGGTLVRIYGTGFFLAGVDNVVASTGVKLGGSGGTAFTSWTTVSDNLIVGITPAKTADTYAVVVYNAAGISTVTQNIVTS
jgi:hypothetical protein